MKINLKDILFIIIGVLILCLALCYKYNEKIITKEVIINKTDTIRVPIKVDTIIYKNRYIYNNDTINVTTIIHDTVLIKQIVKSYFADFVYSDTIVNDTNLTFILSDTISRNMIKSRIYSYSVKYRNSVKTKKTLLFIGGGLDTKRSINVGINIKQGKVLYGTSYNITDKSLRFDLKYQLWGK